MEESDGEAEVENGEEMEGGAQAVRIFRFDGGGYKDKGSFQCMECAWQREGVSRHAAIKHAVRKHGRQARFDRQYQQPPAVRLQERKRKRLQRERNRARIAAAISKSQAVTSWPLAISVQGKLDVCRAFLTPGKGKRVGCGTFDAIGRDAYQLAISCISANAGRLATWLGHGASAPLYDRSTDVKIVHPDAGIAREEASAGACAALALSLLLGGGSLTRDRVVVTGYVDLRGRVLKVDGVELKVEHARRAGDVDLVIAPAANLSALDASGWRERLDAEQQTWVAAHVKGAEHIGQLLQAGRQGFEPPADAQEQLDGPHVGTAWCLGLGEVDGVFDIQVQCCRTSPGTRELRMTGNLSVESVEGIRSLKALVQDQAHSIGSRLLPGVAHDSLSITKRDTDLHVHVENGWRPVHPTYQMGAIYVALASLLVGRRCNQRAAIFGNVDLTSGDFMGDWDLDEQYVANLIRLGLRKLIIGNGISLNPVAAATAAAAHDDGRPAVMVVTAVHMLDVLEAAF